eukprot:GEMP01061931.1.p1 GENE.GEMP01061931.1~~GEMP01061931.1.p1  ORF type:complete len:371 (+),score=67.93 GEMP01061931.1:121-1233(+)
MSALDTKPPKSPESNTYANSTRAASPDGRVRSPSPTRQTSRPSWECYDVTKNGITAVRKLPASGPQRSACDGSQLNGNNRVGERAYDDRPAGYLTVDKYVNMGPTTHAKMVLRSQVCEPLNSWASRLPDRPFNGMPGPLSPKILDRLKKPRLSIDTSTFGTLDNQSLSPTTRKQLRQSPQWRSPQSGGVLRECVTEPVTPTADQMIGSPNQRSPTSKLGVGAIWLSTRSRGELSTFGHQLIEHELQGPWSKLATDLPGDRLISREVARVRDGRLVGFQQVGAMDYHSRQAPLDRQYTVPPIAADASLKFYSHADRNCRLVQRDSRVHTFHWRSASSPNIRLWQGQNFPGSPTHSRGCRAPAWGDHTEWHA